MNVFLMLVALAAPAAAPQAALAPAVAPCPAMPEIHPVPASVAGRDCGLPPSAGAAKCSLTAILPRRFLSTCWSIERRMAAARRRGDAAEVRRMEATRDDCVLEALRLEAW